MYKALEHSLGSLFDSAGKSRAQSTLSSREKEAFRSMHKSLVHGMHEKRFARMPVHVLCFLHCTCASLWCLPIHRQFMAGLDISFAAQAYTECTQLGTTQSMQLM